MKRGGTLIFLGIDTGGTYTDAVLFDIKKGVVSTAKAPTTRHNLSLGIEAAVRSVLVVPASDIELVSLSSTLATNAIVEGQGSPICLLLIGYDPRLIGESRFDKLVASGRIVYVTGGHNVHGDEQQPLDIEAVRRAVVANAPYVSAFAVSGYFSVRNPDHELRTKSLIRRLTSLPVTCGHELTSQLDAPRRAITVALNARLISLMHGQILELQTFLSSLGVSAPLMVVKGDGSLIDADMALERPVETILSGPAASVVGAMYLSKKRTGIVTDIGGTTTDVGVVRNGLPALSNRGARIGGWQTMVEALDVHTTGLGGDSEVRVEKDGKIVVGPRRVIPLCMLATAYPSVVATLRNELRRQPADEDGIFVIRQREPPGGRELTARMRIVWERLADGPLSLTQLMEGADSPTSVAYAAGELIDEGLISACAFTPTDAVHVLGHYTMWSAEASQLGAYLRARRLGMRPDEFCREVIRRVVVQAGHIILESALVQEESMPPDHEDKVNHLLLDRALGAAPGGNLEVSLSLKLPVIGVGAPAATYLKPLARLLHTTLRVPGHAAVCNAIGAVVGGVVQTVKVLIRQPAGVDGPYRVYVPTGIRDFADFEHAVAYGKSTARRLARRRAHQAGATHVRVQTRYNNESVGESGDAIFLGAEIIATAAGRPRLKEWEPVTVSRNSR